MYQKNLVSKALGHFPAVSSRMAWRLFFRGGVILLPGKTDTAQRQNLTQRQLKANAGWSPFKCDSIIAALSVQRN